MNASIRAWAWLPLLWCASAVAAPDKPYQLCEIALSRAHSIDSNYRYPPRAVQRTIEGTERRTCDHPAHEVVRNQVCGDHGSPPYCGYGDHHEEINQCGESPGWWYEFEFARLAYRTDQGAEGPGLRAPWPRNAAVEVLQNFPVWRRYERYRFWPFDDDRGFELRDTVEGVVYVGRKDPTCYTMAHLVGFFNGVWNTKKEAEQSLEEIKKQDFVGPQWRGAPIRYELFYNQSCKRKADDVCLQDVAEVFRQRSAELDGLLSRRWEYFWDQVTGQSDQADSFTERLVARVVRSDKALASWFDGLANATLAKITALSTALADDPPTAQDTAGHTAQLIRAGQRAERVVLVAHSQGNLFVNAAYDAYLAHSRQAGKAVGEDTGYVAAQVVHIAPASPTLRGPYVLADSDVVINGLRRVDGTYLPVSNVSLPVNSQDRSGHKLLATYLDEAGPVRAQIRQFVTQALDAL